MQIDLRDQQRQRVGWIEVDPAVRPTRVAVTPSPKRPNVRAPIRGVSATSTRSHDRLHNACARFGRLDVWTFGRLLGLTQRRDQPPTPHDAFLDWEAALDDAGHLRRCVACECNDLYKSKAFPQITALVVVLAFAGAVIGVIGLATTPVLIAMTFVLVLDVGLLLFSKQRLVCYRCGTSYHRLPIARYHRWWDRTVAERYPAPLRDELAAAAGRGVHVATEAAHVPSPPSTPDPEPVKSTQPQSMFAD